MSPIIQAFKNGKAFITRREDSILRAAGFMFLIMLATKVVGLITRGVLAYYFGTSREFDMFWIATTIPDMISMIFIFGTINAAFIPVLSKVLAKEGQEKLSYVFSVSLNVAIVLFTVLASIAFVFARPIIEFSVSFANPTEVFTPNQIDSMVSMMRFMFLSQIILGISTIITSILQVHQRFFITQIAPLIYNVGGLIGAVILVPFLGVNIWGYIFGLFLGSILHLMIQIPVFKNLSLNYRFIWDLKDKDMREIIRLSIPRTIGSAIDQISILVSRVLAIGFVEGSISALNQALGIINIPFSLFGHTFSTAAFPFLSKDYGSNNMDSFKKTFFKTFQEILFFILPVALLIVVLRVPVVRLFYGQGQGTAFNWFSTLMTSWVILFFGLDLIFESLRIFLVKVYYATHDTKRPVIFGVISIVLGIIFMILFANYFSHFSFFSIRQFVPSQFETAYFFEKSSGSPAIGGIAFGISLATLAEVLLLLFFINKTILKLSWGDFYIPTLKKVFAATITVVITYLVFSSWDNILDTAKTVNVFIMTSLTALMGLSLYITTASILNDREVLIIYRFLEKQGQRVKGRFVKE